MLDKKVYPISRGDLVVVSPNIMHTEYSSADSPLEYMIIGVDNIAFDLLVEDEESESDLPPTIFHFSTITIRRIIICRNSTRSS